MKVAIELFGTIRHVDSRYSRTGVTAADLLPGAKVADALATLGLDTVAVQLALVTVNGQRATLDTPLHEGDVVRLISSVSGG
ncbi:MAG: MoaD/ThiS family protein [Firmicutes bacterium]|jgi:sulfur carrier protein ThiS|nr:MoaD/ThiS family protein [Bacillota bacterium]